MRSARTYVQLGMGAIFLLLLLLFIFHQTRGLLTGVSILIESPENGALLHEPLLTVKGTAKKVAFISLNGRQIFTDENGLFEESLLLAPGYTIITLSAEDTFKRTVQKQIEVVYAPENTLPVDGRTASSSPVVIVPAGTSTTLQQR
ncbi:MAG: Uncharacterized protein G01um101448_1016 [Parcubacteria group bacterium Gr01-1014_48]|nr:MAG: Uncharacterized protein Greene041614_853 [Parcubacteria group bacterium Greene0416_14]TSC72251.1 MAG: Uncharacterized protein G01um101448_1016 [Parcubacteria group bacterium Gr01-1014_48]TSD00639.1 MAG: Uncharacterized protein Greene101415_742 [Parcubacteria group bacterium Greene1014_15]TSD08075.1 MAG: Uncharacterized protein Greene07144_425 [Parcubacteria group bacterium Greene0714_4]